MTELSSIQYECFAFVKFNWLNVCECGLFDEDDHNKSQLNESGIVKTFMIVEMLMPKMTRLAPGRHHMNLWSPTKTMMKMMKKTRVMMEEGTNQMKL